MSDIRRLRKLYNEIPIFICKPGCTDCCGGVPFSELEWSLVQDKRASKLLRCEYSLDGKCDIYEQRPMVCRLFGASEDERLQCPHGCKPEKQLTKEKTNEIMTEYMNRFIHGKTNRIGLT